jgi:hypothetical protein
MLRHETAPRTPIEDEVQEIRKLPAGSAATDRRSSQPQRSASLPSSAGSADVPNRLP